MIALIITVIIMLILVGVTINVALNGGVFTTAQGAADDTKKEAEKEQLLSAMLAAVGTNGEVDFTKVKLPDGFTQISEGVYKGKSGTTYTVNKKTLAITENSGEIKIPEEDITGKYYYALDEEGISIKLNADGTGNFFACGENEETGEYLEADIGTLTYTYDKTTSSLSISGILYPGEGDMETTGEFEYTTIVDSNNNIINQVLIGTLINESVNTRICFNKQNNAGLIPLTGYTYENGTKTIEFGTSVKYGKTFGTYVIKENGVAPASGADGNYICYKGELLWDEGESNASTTIPDDYSTITLPDGAVFTKQ